MSENANPRNGFTIVELLVVLAIVALLAGLLFPVLSAVKSDAKRTGAISNMHQSYIAMQLYAPEEAFPQSLPNKPILEPYLGTKITCDPSDTWRTSCDAPSTPFTVGSFGYVRAAIGGLNDDGEWASFCQLGTTPLFISPFYLKALPRIDNENPLSYPYWEIDQYKMPTQMLTLWSDGKIGMSRVADWRSSELFTWSEAFSDIHIFRN